MAQMNNNQMNNRNMQANKPMENHSWAIKELTRNDVLATNQWPIKVVRDEGKQTKMEIRSITDLNKSFEGTRHNLLQCPKVRSRYTLLYDELMKHSQDISNISHLAITYDTVYYMVNKEVKKSDGNIENKPEFKYFSFGTDIFNEDDIERVTNGILLSSGYFDYIIKDDFNTFNEAYKMLQAESKQMKLKDTEFRAYVKRLPEYNAFGKTMSAVLKNRQKLKVIDNVKPLIDVLKSELNFANLEYLFFIPYPNEAVDYCEVIKLRLLGKPYSLDYRRVGVIAEELKKVPSLSIEEPGFNSFIDELRQKKHNRTVRKAYLLKSNDVTPKAIYNLFLNVKNSESSVTPIYISDAEQARILQAKEQLRKEYNKQEELEKKAKEKELEEKQKFAEKHNNKLDSINRNLSYISEIISIMVMIHEKSHAIYQKGRERNDVETSIWMKGYNVFDESKPLMKERINSVFVREHINSSKKDTYVENDLPIPKILDEYSNFMNNRDSLKTDFFVFNSFIMPTHFKDNRKTLNSIGYDFTKINNFKKYDLKDNLLELENISIDDMKKGLETFDKLDIDSEKMVNRFIDLFEVYLGVQYATFGAFMARYGAGGLDIAKILLKNLTETMTSNNKEFAVTKNVMEMANKAFYLVRLNKYSFNENEKSENFDFVAENGPFEGFVKKYLEKIKGVEYFTHADIENKDDRLKKQFKDLVNVTSSIYDIMDFLATKYNLDYDAVIEEMAVAIQEKLNK